MKWFSRTISGRLARMNLLVNGLVLVIAFVAFYSIDLVSYRQSLERTLRSEASIVGTNSVSALLFDDPESARRTLEALSRTPNVTSAALVTGQGRVFASYQRTPATPLPPTTALDPGESSKTWSDGARLVVAYRITFSSSSAGTVYIAASTADLQRRAAVYGLTALGVLAVCLIFAIVLGARFQRSLADPVIALAETARRVSADRDYSIRAHAGAKPDEELAALVDAFNTMLAEIRTRDAALRRSRDELEVRVEERTAELENKNRELEAFASMVAHDLRGPLDAVLGIVFLVRKQAQTDELELLDQIRASVGNMATLIDNLLQFSKSAGQSLETREVNLTLFAREAAHQLGLGSPARNVDWVLKDTPIALGDPVLLRQVIENLIGNAWKYTSRQESTRIEFGFVDDQEGGYYFVSDNGAGFDAARAKTLFQPFQRLHAKSEFPGSGIGLATVRRILNRHGGTIWADGAVNRGARFFFRLPHLRTGFEAQENAAS